MAEVRLLQPEPAGIGGWLILPLVGLILSTMTLLYSLWADTLPYFEEPLWSALRTPTSSVYSWYWAPYVITTAILGVGLAVWAIALIVLFVQRRRSLPLLISCFYLGVPAAAVFDLLSVRYLSTQVAALDAAAMTQGAITSLVRSLAVAAVWIAYFRRSVRVRNTFVH